MDAHILGAVANGQRIGCSDLIDHVGREPQALGGRKLGTARSP